uniref:Uncharacterized protein n=1 Tax=Anguilla anguilla TaxID=7936 RepID=A0A0E9PZX3_ANGAN
MFHCNIHAIYADYLYIIYYIC